MPNFRFTRRALNSCGELGLVPAQVAGTLARALEHRLGARVRHLAGQVQRLQRLRLGDVRAIFARAEDAVGGWVVVHVARRREVYRGQLDRLADALGNPDSWEVVAPETQSAPDAPLVEPVLDEVQAAVLGGFDDEEPMGSTLTLAHGPPGSGKSLVALEAAVTAVQNSGLALVLCPSDGLVAWFLDQLGPGGFGLAPERDDPARVLDGAADIGVFRRESFFGALTGLPRDREARFRAWWKDAVEADWRAKACLAEWGFGRDGRLVDLADALFPVFSLPSRAKDALRDHDEHRLKALAELDRRCGVDLRQAAANAGVFSRYEMAGRAGGLLKQRDGDLVIIADEVQDFAPEEWRVLASAAVRWRHAGSAAARMFAFGDENQRLTATGFAWRDLEDAAAIEARALGAPTSGLVRRVELPGSYRLRREIAGVARPLLRAPILDLGARHVATADPDQLVPGGEVRLMVSDDLAEFNGRLAALGPGGPVRVITDSPLDAAAVIGLTVPQAKGLEWDAAIVFWPLGGGNEPVDFDRAARAYTALTRARARLLIVVSTREWELLRQAWPSLTPSEPALEWFDSLREREELDELVGRMDNLAEEATREGWSPPRLDDLLRLAHRASLEGGSALVAERGEAYRRSSSELDLLLGPRRFEVGALALLGEWGAASILDPRLSAASGVAAASRALRLRGAHGPETDTVALLARALVALLGLDEAAASPVLPGRGPVESRWERERQRIEVAAESHARARLERCSARIEQRLDAVDARLSEGQGLLDRAAGSPPKELR